MVVSSVVTFGLFVVVAWSLEDELGMVLLGARRDHHCHVAARILLFTRLALGGACMGRNIPVLGFSASSGGANRFIHHRPQC